MAFLASLPGVAGPVLAVLAGAYVALIAVMACTAVYSQRPARRRAAFEVLILLLPAKRNGRRVDDFPPGAERRTHR